MVKKKLMFVLSMFIVGYVVVSVGKTGILSAKPVERKTEEKGGSGQYPNVTAILAPATVTEAVHPAPFGAATATPDLTKMSVYHLESVSPNGQWIVEVVEAFPSLEAMRRGEEVESLYYIRLTLRSADGSMRWVLLDEWSQLGLGYTYFEPVRWSEDSQRFYYTNVPVPEGCSGVFINGSDLYEVNVANGEVREILPPRTTRWIALSPDGKTLAYYRGGSVILRTLASDQEHVVRLVKIEAGKGYEGKIVWSPDGRALAATVSVNACFTVEDGEYTSVLFVDAASLEVKPILLEDKQYRTAEEWLGPGRLVLRDPQGRRWVWDARTELLTVLEADAPVETPSGGGCRDEAATPTPGP